jgi:hypothetical protein
MLATKWLAIAGLAFGGTSCGHLAEPTGAQLLVGVYALDSLDSTPAPFTLANTVVPGCTTRLSSATLTVTPQAPAGGTGLGFSLALEGMMHCPLPAPDSTPEGFGTTGNILEQDTLLGFYSPSGGPLLSLGVLKQLGPTMDTPPLGFLGTHRLVFRAP